MRRQATVKMIDLLGELAKYACSPTAYLLQNNLYPSSTAYYAAVSRLKKKGLITRNSRPTHEGTLELTAAVKKPSSIWFNRLQPWARRWNGIWYLLIYDVPERRKAYRDTLRRFLIRQRLGCLQKSAWVTPTDIRPDYADLCKAAGLAGVSYLVEMQTVLGRDAQDVVCTAWDVERLEAIQGLYCEVYNENLEKIKTGDCPEEALVRLVIEEQEAYLMAMDRDPILPRPLWPKGYRGLEAWNLHRKLTAALAQRLR